MKIGETKESRIVEIIKGVLTAKMTVPFLIISIGFGIILFPKAKEMYADYKGDQEIKNFERMLDEGNEEISVELEDLEESNPDDLALGTQAPVKKDFEGNASIIGIIYIDSIDLKLPITEGSDTKALDGKIVGHETSTVMPNEIGNCALASHRSVTKNRNFNRLNEVKKGDGIKITSINGTVEYEVYDSYIVPRSDGSPLNQPKDKTIKEITLITCDPIGVKNPPNRIIVKAVEK
ncbi:MAG: class D sortase [Clostridiales bacterium]